MAKRLPKKSFWKSQENHFLLLSLGVAVAVGIPTVRSLLVPSENMQVSFDQGSGRNPASVSVSPEEPDRNVSQNKAKSLTVELDCSDLKMDSEIDASHLRLMSNNCDLKNIVIKNSRNGYTASVVDLGAEKFTTDFIELANGENLLTMTASDHQGHPVAKEFKINRRSPASN